MRHELFLTTKSFRSLDGLRALAIIAVLWHHSGYRVDALIASRRGFLGVDLFFVVSGFLIVTLLLRERRRTGDISLRNFYVRRFLRIFPAYYATLLLVGSVAFLTHGNTTEAMRRDLPFAIAYLSNLVPMTSILAPTWSLSTEEQFYLVVPWLQRHAKRAVPVLIPALYVLVTLPALGFFPDVAFPSFFRETTFGPIILGVALAHVLDDPKSYSWAAKVVGGRFAPALALALVVAAASNPWSDVAGWSGWPRVLIHWTLFALVASCVVRENHVLAPMLTLWPLRRIGMVSYGIYLYHMIVMHFVAKILSRTIGMGELWLFVSNALASWFVAELSYRWFESRFLALKSRFASERIEVASAVPNSSIR